ncbi:MAG TPA: hypothetical protein VH880_07375 [Anaeromyxobacteraceae bacterium]|jgi:hypothetical protein
MLSIRAMGLASSLGGLVQAGAAFRAGITRVAPAPDVEMMFPGDEAPQPLPVHALPSATLGFSGTGRLVALLVEAIRDLLDRLPLPARPQDLGLFLALPDPEERGFALAAEPEDEDPEEPDARRLALGERLAALAGAGAGLDLSRLPLRTVGDGHAGFPAALALAEAAIQGREVAAALVCAVDSLVSADALDLFLEAGRIKTDENPVGFVPGEAAAALLLEPPGRGGGGREPDLRLVAVARATESQAAGSDRPPDGRVLAECVRAVIGPEAPPPLLVSDHDGEPFRAGEFGALRVQLQRTHPGLASAASWFPAVGFGNTGVASAAVGIAAVMRALERGAAPSRSAVILSSADAGQRSAVHVAARPEARGSEPRGEPRT